MIKQVTITEQNAKSFDSLVGEMLMDGAQVVYRNVLVKEQEMVFVAILVYKGFRRKLHPKTQ